MCGIVGVWDFKNKINPDLLIKTRDTLKHRGPDDAGIFIDEKNNLGLGHQRLSILDLTQAGHQPMEIGNLVITYNGEVYNFKEIRKELEKRGYNFLSNSDTEVILKSYLAWGTNCLEKFRGMFAFGIWDKEKKRLILVRDRTGIKPLYYYFNENLFIFASEIKAIISHPQVKKEINFNALASFLQFGYISAPYSIFKNIWKLEAGHILEIDKNKKLRKRKYWDVSNFYLKQNNSKNQKLNEITIQNELERILTESFKLRMISDVEVGMFLSGGLDSSLVSAILAKKLGYKLKTFTIGFYEEEFNEAPYAQKIAQYLGTEHHEKYCTKEEAMKIIPRLPEIYDEPFGDSSAIPTILLAQFTKKYLKVSLSADGGDEIFIGYDRYWRNVEIFQKINRTSPFFLIKPFLKFISPDLLAQFYKKLNFILPKQTNIRNKILKLKEVLKNQKDFVNLYYLAGLSYWLPTEIKKLLNNKFNKEHNSLFINFTREKKMDNFSLMQLIDYKTYLPDDILVKIDRATMSVGLEGRDPLLDNKIIEFVAQLPSEFKYRNGVSKYIMRNILYKYIPKELLNRPKQGFGIPIDNWFKKDLKPLLNNYVNEKRIKRDGIFNWPTIKDELNGYYKGAAHVSKLWFILVFQMWKEKWLK